MIKLGINGFGRIGRLAARTILAKYKDVILLKCINTSGSMDASGWAHLFKYDTTYGKYPEKVTALKNSMKVGNVTIPILGERDPEKIPWQKYGVEVVIESTGKFRKEKDIIKHLRGTVKKVVLSAPPKKGNVPMYVLGINDHQLKNEKIISCASCTTNCAAPVTKVINESFGIKKAFMSTIHAYTSDQELLDGSHKDLRRGRAASQNIVPTTTGAAKAVGAVYVPLKGKFDGLALRVPVICGSLVDFVFVIKKKTTIEKVNKAFEAAALGKLKGILAVTKEPIVSGDVIGLEASALVDLSLTNVVEGDLVKVIAWYDNEWGYVQRLVEEAVLLGKKL